MIKVTIYVLVIYAIYYAIAIGLEYLKSPEEKKDSRSQSFSVGVGNQDIPIAITDADTELSSEAAGALKKN